MAALERGLSVLAAFQPGRNTLTLAELAALTGFYKSTILRLVASLMHFDYLQRLEDGRYRPGPACFLLGRLYQGSFDLGETVIPALRQLASETGESASFYIRQGRHDVCLHRVESGHALRDAGISEGDRFPIDDSACATILSAFANDRPEWAAVRRQTVLVSSHSTRAAGVTAIVCPVFGIDDRLTGALLLSGPESRLCDPVLDALTEIVVEHATRLTRALGGIGTAYASYRRLAPA